jgi:RNA polymerase sigma-70 factor (ECF subfamily)
MEENNNWLANQFEENRPHLRAVAYRMLGSLSEAEDAVQEGWLRLSRSDTSAVENLSGWLTTVVARVSLDMLRSRKSKHEESLEKYAEHVEQAPDTLPDRKDEIDPEQEALLADSVGLALLVVLETLAPAERLAFVLHDMFDLSFDEIAPIVDRSPTAARQLASRARRRIQGAETVRNPDLTSQRQVVDAFLAAARGGNFEALLAVLDPEAVLRSDPAALPPGAPTEIRGAAAIANRAAKGSARAAQPALVNGEVGVIIAPRGRLLMVLRFTITNGKIIEIEAVADPGRLRHLDLAVLND